MSRTTRKVSTLVEYTEVAYINRNLYGRGRYRRMMGYEWEDFFSKKQVRRRLTKKEYKEDHAKAIDDYNKRMAFFRKFGYRDDLSSYDYCYRREPWYPYSVSKYKYIDIPWSIEQEVEELRKEYYATTRDGKWAETSRKSGFKEEAAQKVRLANKKFCGKVLRGDDYDNTPYPTIHEGDHLVWNYW